MNRNRVGVVQTDSNDLSSSQNPINSSRKLDLPSNKRKYIRNVLLTIVAILITTTIITLVAIIVVKNKSTRSNIKSTMITTAVTIATTTITPFSNNISFDSATLRFLFTMTNQSPHPFILTNSNRWYGHIDGSVRKLEPGNGTHMSMLHIRGVRSNDIATGVTYALCFRMHDTDGYATNIRLNIYLQVAFFGSNYFGWTFYDGSDCYPANKWWYTEKERNQMKKNCADPVLNKGGTLSLTASCYNMKIEMLTDNDALSTPRMMIETEKIKKD